MMKNQLLISILFICAAITSPMLAMFQEGDALGRTDLDRKNYLKTLSDTQEKRDTLGRTKLMQKAESTIYDTYVNGAVTPLWIRMYNLDICKPLINAAATKAKQENIYCLLMALKHMEVEGHLCASLLYKHRDKLLKPHLQNLYCKPLKLLRMKNNEGQTAYDHLPVEWLNPEEENKQSIAVVSQVPNKMLIRLRIALDEHMPAQDF